MNNKSYLAAYKTPSICHPEKPAISYGLCGSCRQKRDAHKYRETKRLWAERFRLKYPEINKKRQIECKLKSNYGITTKQRDEMIEQQKHRCLICNREKPLVCDHNHITLKFRGMICYRCNLLTRYIESDPEYFPKIQKYLNEH